MYMVVCDVQVIDAVGNVSAECPQANRHEISVDPNALTNQPLNSTMSDLNAADVAQVFGMGFSIVVLFFLIGRGVGTVLSLIRRG